MHDVAHRQNHHRHGDVASAQILDQLEPIGAVQREIHDGDIGSERFNLVECRRGVSRLAADLEVGLLIDRAGQPLRTTPRSSTTKTRAFIVVLERCH